MRLGIVVGGGLQGRGNGREARRRESELSAMKGLRGLMLRGKGIRQSTFCIVFV